MNLVIKWPGFHEIHLKPISCFASYSSRDHETIGRKDCLTSQWDSCVGAILSHMLIIFPG